MQLKPWAASLAASVAFMGAESTAQTAPTEPSAPVSRDAISREIAMVAVGQVVTSSLDDGDPRARSDARYEDYAINLDANTVLEVQTTGAFEPRVSVLAPVGGRDDLLLLGRRGSEVARGGSRVLFAARRQGLYIVRMHGPAQGEYSIAFRRGTVTPPRPTDVSIGQTISGSLEEGGPRTSLQILYRDYRLTGAPRDRVGIRATATGPGLDPYLEIGEYVPNGVLDVSKANDDFGAGVNSYIPAVLPEDGELIVRVRGFSEDDLGAFTLSVEPLPQPGRAAQAQRLRADQPRSDALSMTDPMVGPNDFRPLKYYELRGTRGETYSIDVESAQFQPVVSVGVLTPVGFTPYRTSNGAGMQVDVPGDGVRPARRLWIPAPARALLRTIGLTGDSTRNSANTPTENSDDTHGSSLRFRMPASGSVLLRITTQQEGEVGDVAVLARAVPPIQLVSHGLYSANRGNCETLPTGITHCGTTNHRLQETTTSVEGRIGVRFGANIRVTGVVGEADERTLRQVWRFPPPGLRPPNSDRVLANSERTITIPVDFDYFSTFELTHPWEVVPGVWALEYWDDEKHERIFSQEFTVSLPSARSAE